jgi:hypothetical protein
VNFIVQYTSQESNKKFAAVHLPTTMPGLDIMLTALVTDDKVEEVENKIFTKQTFAQININSELQTINKAAQQMFWDNIIKSSKNEARKSKMVDEDLKFHESYYNTSAADKYNLVDIKMKEIKPSDEKNGYTKEEIVSWFSKLKADQKVAMGKEKEK